MRKKQKQDVIKHFQEMASRAGKKVDIALTHDGIRLTCAGRSAKLPQGRSQMRHIGIYEKRLGLG